MSLKLYGASKIDDWLFWYDAARNAYFSARGVTFCNRWYSLCLAARGHKDKPNSSQAERAWLIDFIDLRKADAIVLLCPAEDEHLKGALVEVGAGLALGKPVLVLGKHPDLSSWQYHPLVYGFSDHLESLANLEDAVEYLLSIGD